MCVVDGTALLVVGNAISDVVRNISDGWAARGSNNTCIQTSGKMLYMTNTPEWDDFMNCFVELKGNHRFKDDPEYGQIIVRYHDRKHTRADVSRLNTRVLGARGGTTIQAVSYTHLTLPTILLV